MPNGLIKIDVDPGQPLYTKEHMKRLLARAGYWLASRWKRRSGSGKGWHVFVEIMPHPRTDMEKVALQAILGSDRYREACNVSRVRTLDHIDPSRKTYWGKRWNVTYDANWEGRK